MPPVRAVIAAVLGLLACAGEASAASLTLHVVNERGTPQFTAVQVDSNGWRPSDPYGSATLDVAAGSVVSVTRDPFPPANYPPPEGAAGVSHTVTQDDLSAGSLTLTVPNATGPAYQPALSDAERWVVGKLNQDRAAHGLAPMQISTTLTAAADAVAHDSAVKLAASGGYPFPPPYFTVIFQDWGWPHNSAAGLDAPTTDPAKALAHWTDGSEREQLVLNPQITAIGIGDGGGSWVAQLGACPSPGSDRCGMTSDTGDPNIVLPAPTNPSPRPSPRPSPSTYKFHGRTSQKLGIAFTLTATGLQAIKAHVDLPKGCGPGITTIESDSAALKGKQFVVNERIDGERYTIAGSFGGAGATGTIDFVRPGHGRKKHRHPPTCRGSVTWSATAAPTAGRGRGAGERLSSRRRP